MCSTIYFYIKISMSDEDAIVNKWLFAEDLSQGFKC